MSMRNFWIESNVEGRSSSLASGPRRNDGRMDTTLYVNASGSSTKAVSVNCYPNSDGTLEVTTRVFNGDTIKVVVDKASGEMKVHNYFKQGVAEILADKSITPTARLKKIAELL